MSKSTIASEPSATAATDKDAGVFDSQTAPASTSASPIVSEPSIAAPPTLQTQRSTLSTQPKASMPNNPAAGEAIASASTTDNVPPPTGPKPTSQTYVPGVLDNAAMRSRPDSGIPLLLLLLLLLPLLLAGPIAVAALAM
ncbi:hypothetical protein MBLNU459_g5679t1 [Dothideomycetes sp. NU459]